MHCVCVCVCVCDFLTHVETTSNYRGFPTQRWNVGGTPSELQGFPHIEVECSSWSTHSTLLPAHMICSRGNQFCLSVQGHEIASSRDLGISDNSLCHQNQQKKLVSLCFERTGNEYYKI